MGLPHNPTWCQGMQQHVSGWRRRQAGLPQCANNKIGKGAPLSSQQAVLMRRTVCGWLGQPALEKGAHVCEDLLVNICIAHVTGLQCVLALPECV